MKMTKLEKRFVNRSKKAQKNFEKIRTVLEKIKKENIKDVLEIGCGIGMVSAKLAQEYNFTVYGTDLDAEEIRLAEKLNEKTANLQYRIEDAAALSFKDSSFDLVISQNVFHHIPTWVDAIGEIKRVLRPGGYLIWHDIVFAGLLIKLFKPITKNYGLYTLNDIQSEFDKTGFDVIDKQKMVHGPFKHYQMTLKTG